MTRIGSPLTVLPMELRVAFTTESLMIVGVSAFGTVEAKVRASTRIVFDNGWWDTRLAKTDIMAGEDYLGDDTWNRF